MYINSCRNAEHIDFDIQTSQQLQHLNRLDFNFTMFSRIFWSGLAAASFVAAQGDIAALLATQPDLSTLLSAVTAVQGLAQTLSTSSNITIFAPINSAFDQLLQQDVPEAAALRNRNSTTIEALLVRHVFKGYFSSDVVTDDIAWIESLLTPEYRNEVQPFSNTTGGMNAGVVLNGDDVTVIAGELTLPEVVEAVSRLSQNNGSAHDLHC